MNGEVVNESRRKFLLGATSAVGGAGVVGAAVPFVASLAAQRKSEGCRSTCKGQYIQA